MSEWTCAKGEARADDCAGALWPPLGRTSPIETLAQPVFALAHSCYIRMQMKNFSSAGENLAALGPALPRNVLVELQMTVHIKEP